MKKIVFFHLIPLLLAIIFLFAGSSKINELLFAEANSIVITENRDFRHIPNFLNENKLFEEQFLKSGNDAETIFLLGSSELTNGAETLPFNFLSTHFTTQVKGIGHAGNQCFSIYSQLLANENRLENAPVVIMLSPCWFYGKAAKGTTTELFLEFNSSKFIENILNISNRSDLVPFKKYEVKRVGDFYTEFLNPDINLRLLFLEGQSSKSIGHKWVYYPVIKITEFCNILKQKLVDSYADKNDINFSANRKPIIPESISINWDSLFMTTKQEHLNISTNNSWYINNDYYNQYVKGETQEISIVAEKDNQELEDFYMLVKLLRAKNANASFIIIPLNPYCYINTEEFTPFINLLETELKANQIPCLNLWSSDTATFDKGVLSDIMHLSKYGWYQINKFIVETYHLAK